MTKRRELKFSHYCVIVAYYWLLARGGNSYFVIEKTDNHPYHNTDDRTKRTRHIKETEVKTLFSIG